MEIASTTTYGGRHIRARLTFCLSFSMMRYARCRPPHHWTRHSLGGDHIPRVAAVSVGSLNSPMSSVGEPKFKGGRQSINGDFPVLPDIP